jgi:two-component system OmpR family sensor kinase
MLQGWALDDPETARESVAAIDRESARMQDLVEGLLALTRGDEGPPLDVGRHDLAEVAEEAVQTARAAAGGKVSVGYVPPGGPVEATFDRESVRQAASIVLDNAVKYTPEGGKVVVAVRERDGAVELEVHDNGAGIPQDQLPLIFERFHRADPSRTEGGAGLGLSIARQIAEAHGGAMEAESRPGRGSTFTLSLPQEPMGPPIRTGSGGEDGGSS